MKTPHVLVLAGALLMLSVGSASAQISVGSQQTVNFTVPSVFIVDVSPGTINFALTASDFLPGQDQSIPVTNTSTTYRYVHNNSLGAAISVNVQSDLPAGVGLVLNMSGGVGDIPLTTTPTVAVTSLNRGAGNGTATYTFTATMSTTPSGASSATVVYTLAGI